MRTPDRDRRRFALFALCTALITALVVIPPGGALSADYTVFPNGTAYSASVQIADTARYEFADVGVLGENVPVTVGNVQLFSDNGSLALFNRSSTPWGGNPSTITFPRGNYTLSFTAPLRDNHLQAIYGKAYRVNVTLPQEFDVRNPLLAGISVGANVTRHADNSTQVTWDKTASFDLRFYTQSRESLLYLFVNFMIVIAIVLLLPFLLTRKKAG